MIEDLTLTSGPAAGTAGSGCGCGGCGTSGASARETGGRTATAEAEGVRASYGVLGMTCGHCVAAVTDELTAIDGVTSVAVELVPGGTSLVQVVSTSALERSVVADAVDEAGYDLATN